MRRQAMAQGDDANRYFAGSTGIADHANKLFYEKYGSFPAAPREFRFFEDRRTWRNLLLQEVGDWEHSRIPDSGKIWMPGCGAYHALEMAACFPDQEILATDISSTALSFASSVAKHIGMPNLELRQ